jgi:SAM-dependent methyltransferase
MKFLALCVSGLQDVAAYHLEQEGFDGFALTTVDDGLVAFETAAFPNALAGLRYLNNSFQVFAQNRGRMDDFLRGLSGREEWHGALKRSIFPRERSFRLVLSEGNQLVQGDRQAIGRMGSAIERLTSLAWRPQGADVEFWVMARDDGECYFGRRLSRRQSDQQPGELKPELAHLLCLLSEPEPSDIVLDPFTGSGAIPAARSQMPYNMIFASDRDEAKIEALKARIKAGGSGVKERRNSPFIVRAADALKLERFEDGFIGKVITDPPWGLFDNRIGDIAGFYRDMLHELVRVLKPDGLLVLLLGDRDLGRRLAGEFAADLVLEASFDILVSGKKAVVLKLRNPVK